MAVKRYWRAMCSSRPALALAARVRFGGSVRGSGQLLLGAGCLTLGGQADLTGLTVQLAEKPAAGMVGAEGSGRYHRGCPGSAGAQRGWDGAFGALNGSEESRWRMLTWTFLR